MELLTSEQKEKMLENGRRRAEADEKDEIFDPQPVVKLFTPSYPSTWLLTDLDPDDEDIAFGLCDLGMGYPELGPVSLSELQAFKGVFGLVVVERDIHFKPRGTLQWYTDIATREQQIVA